jgi:hypothetical protein
MPAEVSLSHRSESLGSARPVASSYDSDIYFPLCPPPLAVAPFFPPASSLFLFRHGRYERLEPERFKGRDMPHFKPRNTDGSAMEEVQAVGDGAGDEKAPSPPGTGGHDAIGSAGLSSFQFTFESILNENDLRSIIEADVSWPVSATTAPHILIMALAHSPTALPASTSNEPPSPIETSNREPC